MDQLMNAGKNFLSQGTSLPKKKIQSSNRATPPKRLGPSPPRAILGSSDKGTNNYYTDTNCFA